jgi:serine/threonine protein phosphatase PrpC
MGFSVRAAGFSDVGMKRQNNQDSYLINEKLGLFAVADGMGGHSGGEVASALAVKALEHVFKDRKANKSLAELLSFGVEKSNQIIFDQAAQKSELTGMGTTLTAMAIHKDQAVVAQVGDSRCYIFYEGQLYQLTEDHSQIYELMKLGFVNEENIHNFQKNVITRSVGYEPSVVPDVYGIDLKKNSRFLICSDGLTGMTTHPQMAQILGNFEIEEAALRLVQLANAQGGEDNITAVIVEVK